MNRAQKLMTLKILKNTNMTKNILKNEIKI